MADLKTIKASRLAEALRAMRGASTLFGQLQSVVWPAGRLDACTLQMVGIECKDYPKCEF